MNGVLQKMFNSKITISTDDAKVIEICDEMGIHTD